MYVCMYVCMYICMYVCNVCMHLYMLPCMGYMTIFGKTNQLARKSILMYARNSCSSIKTLMEIKKKEACLTRMKVKH